MLPIAYSALQVMHRPDICNEMFGYSSATVQKNDLPPAFTSSQLLGRKFLPLVKYEQRLIYSVCIAFMLTNDKLLFIFIIFHLHRNVTLFPDHILNSLTHGSV